MHPGKVQPRKVHEGIMTGEDDLLRCDRAVLRDEPMLLRILHACVLKDRQRFRHSPEEFQRMKLCLTLEAHRSGGGKGERRRFRKRRREPQSRRTFRLIPQLFRVVAVDIGILRLKITVDLPLRDHAPNLG